MLIQRHNKEKHYYIRENQERIINMMPYIHIYMCIYKIVKLVHILIQVQHKI